MGPSLDDIEREANRRFHAESLDQQVLGLIRENVKPQVQRFKSLPCTDSALKHPVPYVDCNRSCAILTDSSDDETDTDSDQDGYWERRTRTHEKEEEHVEPATRRANFHGPVLHATSERQFQAWACSPDLLGPKIDEVDEDYETPLESVTNSQRARNAMYCKRHAAIQGPLPGKKDTEKPHVMPEIPWILHPNSSLIRRQFVRRDSLQDGKRFEKSPKVKIGEERLLLPNVLGKVQYAHGYRPPIVKRMRLDGDEYEDYEQFSDEDSGMGLSASKGNERKESSVRRNFWLGMSTLAAWIFHMR